MIRQLILDKANAIQGWMTENELSFLAEKVEHCKIIYEIGSYQGKSARVMADNSPDDCRIYCVDPWNYRILQSNNTFLYIDDTTFGQFHINLYDYIRVKKVIPCPKTWEKYIPLEKADFIFIDGDHSYESVVHDITKALIYLRPGGVIAGHDYNWTNVQKAVDELVPKTEQVDSIWWKRL